VVRFVVGRLLSALAVTWGVYTVVFLLIHIIPGDPVEVMLGEHATAADRAQMRTALGLNDPLPVQYVNYLTGLATGDLGTSIHRRVSIAGLVAERIVPTAQLAFAAIGIAIVIALPLGALAALRRASALDTTSMGVAMLGVSIPNFVLGPLLVLVFSLWLGWFPVSGREALSALVLPAFTLGTALAAILSRMVRSSLLDVLNEDFMRTAYAKGATTFQAVSRHALPNAALPIMTVVGVQIGALLTGAVVTETVFDWPGIGQLTIEAIRTRDYPLLQACVLVVSLVYVAVNTLTDLAYALVDVRVRLQ
jgi:peptide/nickel transport system permease protein